MTHLVIGSSGSIGSRHKRLLQEAGEEVRECDVNIPADWKGVDIVWICTPPMTHHEDIFQALHMGHYIFCEKPLVNEPKVMEEIVKTYEKQKGRIFVASNMRFHPCVQIIKEQLDKGAIGDPVYMRFSFSHHLPYQRENWAESYVVHTGIILDCMQYIDLAIWFAGQQDNLQGFSSILELPIYDFSRMYITHKSRVLSEIALDFIRRDKAIKIEIVGKGGTLYCRMYGKEPEDAHVAILKDKGTNEVLFNRSVDLDEMYRNQMKYILENKPDNFMEHINVLKVAMEATYAQRQ